MDNHDRMIDVIFTTNPLVRLFVKAVAMSKMNGGGVFAFLEAAVARQSDGNPNTDAQLN